jgi:hypothetical protein
MTIKIDWTIIDEMRKVQASPVLSDFELQMQQEIANWIKKQPAHKCWATPAESTKEFWAEKLE